MTDRKLLQAAAKAAELTEKITWWDGRFIFRSVGSLVFKEWNPLTDDGDALRLAVKLNIDVLQHKHDKFVSVRCPTFDFDDDCIFERWGDDKLAATRRAIVRAASQIGGAA